MKRVHVLALAAVVAGTLGSIPAKAAGNSDVYSFLNSEKTKTAAPADASAKAKTALSKGSVSKVAAKRTKVSKANTSRRSKIARVKSNRNLHTKAAPVQLAATDIEAHTRPSVGRKPLGYDASLRDRYRHLIAKHAAENGIPFALGDAVMRVESRYRKESTNAGALGLMQIKHATARDIGYQGDAKGLMEPETNIKYGMKYLGQAYRLANGDTCGTVMRYQSGHYAKRINSANLAYCSNVRTIVASLGTEVARAEVKSSGSATAAIVD